MAPDSTVPGYVAIVVLPGEHVAPMTVLLLLALLLLAPLLDPPLDPPPLPPSAVPPHSLVHAPVTQLAMASKNKDDVLESGASHWLTHVVEFVEQLLMHVRAPTQPGSDVQSSQLEAHWAFRQSSHADTALKTGMEHVLDVVGSWGLAPSAPGGTSSMPRIALHPTLGAPIARRSAHP